MSNEISPMPELDSLLKKLKLSGMINTLAIRNREALENKCTHLEFLTMLAQDEILRRDTSRFAVRIKKAGFTNNKTIENFDFGFNPKINAGLIREIASCRFIEEKVPVIFKGSCGTGKSHLAQAIGHCAACKGIDVRFFTQSKLIGILQAAKAAGDYNKQLKQLTKVPLLIIDDFGLKPLRSPEDEYFHELVAERYERASTMITSNLDLDEWLEVFSNQLLGAASIDRLKHGAYQILLLGKSYRSIQPDKAQKKVEHVDDKTY